MSIKEIGERIRLLREKRGFTQLAVAKALNVKRQTVAQWENGERDLKTGYIISLAQFFNVTSDYLLGLSSCKTPRGEARIIITGIIDEKIDAIMETERKIKVHLDCISSAIEQLKEVDLIEAKRRFKNDLFKRQP